MDSPLASVFAEHKSPQHCGKRAVHDGLRPVAALVAAMQKQMVEYRARLSADLLTDDSRTGTNEHIHQTIEATERDVAVLARAVRAVAKDFTQLDRYMADQESAA